MAEYEDWSRETMKVTFCHIFFCWSHFCRAIFTSHFLLLVTFLISPHISRRTHLNFQWSTLRRGHLEGREPAMPGTRILKDTIGPSGPQIASPIGKCWYSYPWPMWLLQQQCSVETIRCNFTLGLQWLWQHWATLGNIGPKIMATLGNIVPMIMGILDNIGQYLPNHYGNPQDTTCFLLCY